MVSVGGIIYRINRGIIEVFFIKDPYGKWTFPKGRQEANETFTQTAVREIREETGFTGLEYLAPLGRTSFRFRRDVGVIQKTVHYLLFKAPADAQPKFKSPEEREQLGGEPIFEGRWVPMAQSFAVSSYKNSDHLLAQAYRLIAMGK